MGPRPYSDRSVLPRDSSNSSVSVESDTAQMTADSSPGSLSAATTPSPVDHEILTDINANTSEIEEDEYEMMHSSEVLYPTQAETMPFDHAFPDFIRQLTNERNLANVHSLRLRVISRLVSLQRVSLFTTNLRELDLEGSILGSLRDIGCNLKHLQVLKVGNCKLDSLDGTFGLTSLRRLYAQRNMITDVSPCSNLPHIQHIDVSRNRIRNIGYAGFLSVCRKLKTIIFTGNPAAQLSDYRDHVRRLLPQLESLDDVMFSEGEKEFQQGEMDDFYDLSEEDQNNFYCNTFEEEGGCSSLERERSNSMNDISKEAQFEIQEILKYDSKGFHGRDSKLLSLRKERDEKRQLSANRHGRSFNVNFEEMEDIVENCSVSTQGQSADSSDGFTLPPLSMNEKEAKKKSHLAKEIVLQGANYRNDNSKIGDGAASLCTDSNLRLDIPNFEAMGARPKTLGIPNRPSTATDANLHGSGYSQLADGEWNGMKKRPFTAGGHSIFHEVEKSDEKLRKNSLQSGLTSGRPICGNLAIALRNRKKEQEIDDGDDFSREEEPEKSEVNRMQ